MFSFCVGDSRCVVTNSKICAFFSLLKTCAIKLKLYCNVQNGRYSQSVFFDNLVKNTARRKEIMLKAPSSEWIINSSFAGPSLVDKVSNAGRVFFWFRNSRIYFLPRCMPRYGEEISVCLSVCPSHAWIVAKR